MAEATDIFEQNYLSSLVQGNNTSDAVRQQMITLGYEGSQADTVAQFIEDQRAQRSPTSQVQQQDVSQVQQETPQAISATDVSQVQQETPQAISATDVFSEDILNDVASGEDALENIKQTILDSGRNEEQANAVVSHIEQLRGTTSDQIQQTEEFGLRTPKESPFLEFEDELQKPVGIEDLGDITFPQEIKDAESIEFVDYRDLTPDSIAASVRQISSRNLNTAKSLVALLGSETARQAVTQDHKTLTTNILNALKAGGVANPRIIKGGIKVSNGITDYGDIVYETGDGQLRIVEESFLQGMIEQKTEIGGSIGGAALAGAGTGLLTANPFLIVLGALGGGLLGAGLGAGIDTGVNAWELKKELDSQVMLSKMIDAGIGDTVFGVLGLGVGKAGIKLGSKALFKTVDGEKVLRQPIIAGVGYTGKKLKALYNVSQEWIDNPEAAVKSIAKMEGLTDEDFVNLVGAFNKRYGTTLDPSNPKDKIRAGIEGTNRIHESIRQGARKSASKGVGILNKLKQEGRDLTTVLDKADKDGLTVALRDEIQQYGRETSNLFGSIKSAGSDLVDDDWTFDFGKLALDDLTKRIQTDSNLGNEELLTLLSDKLIKIRQRGVPDLTPLKEGLEGRADVIKGDTKLVKEAEKSARSKIRTERARITEDFKKAKADLDNQIVEARSAIKDKTGTKDELDDLIETRRILVQEKQLEGAKEAVDIAEGSETLTAVQSRLSERVRGAEDTAADILSTAERSSLEAPSNRFRDFENLLELRQEVGSLSRNEILVKNSAVREELFKVTANIDKEISRAANQHMGSQKEGKLWLDMMTQVRREYASSKELLRNDVVKELSKAKPNFTKVIDQSFTMLDRADRGFAEVADRLAPATRKNFEKAMLSKVKTLNTHDNIVDWVGFSEQIRKFPMRDTETRAMKVVAKEMAEVFTSRKDLGKNLANATIDSTSAGFNTDLKGKSRATVVSAFFDMASARIGFTHKQQERALVRSIARILDNPLDSKSIKTLLKETEGAIPADETWSFIRRLQENPRVWGTNGRYSETHPTYARTTAGEPAIEGGLRKLSTDRELVTGKGPIKQFNVTVRNIASEFDIEKELGRPFVMKDLRNKELIQKLEEAGKKGMNIDNEVYLFPNTKL